MPIYQAGPDVVATTRAALQRAGVPFDKAQSVKPAELRRAAADEDVMRRLVKRLMPRKSGDE